MIDVDKMQEKVYKIFLKVYEVVIVVFRLGNVMLVVYKVVYVVVEFGGLEFLFYFMKNVGIGIGIEFWELGLILNVKNECVICFGMVFNVLFGFYNLIIELSNLKFKMFFFFLVDIVIVVEKGLFEVLILKCFKMYIDIVYLFKDDEEDEEVKVEVKFKVKLESNGFNEFVV